MLGHDIHSNLAQIEIGTDTCRSRDARLLQDIADYRHGQFVCRHAVGQQIQRCNIEFAQVTDTDAIRTRVWERGSGITMACGTGACATAVAAALTKHTGRKSSIVMDGGTLEIEYSEADDHVYMTGPAAFSFEGEIEL